MKNISPFVKYEGLGEERRSYMQMVFYFSIMEKNPALFKDLSCLK